jgi:hypothetical protein
MKPLSELLTDLIGFAEEVITRPQKYHGFRVDDRFFEFAAAMRHADSLPAEGIRTTRAGVMMITALEEFFAGDHEPTSRWLMVAGSLLPLLRGEAWQAMRNEKDARGQNPRD